MLVIGPVDEAIWHFIGLFRISEEAGRMRVDYDPMLGRLQDQQLDPIPTQDYVPVLLATKGDFEASFRNIATPTLSAPTAEGVDLSWIAPTAPMKAWSSGPWVSLPAGDSVASAAGAAPPVPWVLTPPGSVVAVILQQNALFDDDFLNPSEFGDALIPDTAILARLETLTEAAQSLGVSLALELPEDESDFVAMAAQVQQASAEAMDAEAPAGAVVAQIHGEDTIGLHINGELTEERPEVDSLKPVYLRPQPEPEDDAAPDDAPAHEVIAGANVLVNQVALTASWISAPVLYVAGQSISHNLISQVNVVSDMDSVHGGGFGSGPVGSPVGGRIGGEGPTQTFNMASITVVSTSGTGTASTGHAGGGPIYAVATLDASLISLNWVDQRNFVSDNDVASLTLTGSETLLVTGANGVTSTISLLELGAQFDVIVVDGSMININAVLQTNVLLDDDRISVSGANGVSISSGDNLLVNDAVIYQSGAMQGGQLTQVQMQNLAHPPGTDLSLPAVTLQDPALAGLDVVRVLHITGDLVSMNVIRQTNILGDSDQIQLSLSEAQQAMGDAAHLSVVTGSNMLVNAATLAEFAVDATVYTGQGYYSDALLHQAELISTDDPLAPGAGALASEAVLFLADSMLGDDDPGGGDVTFGPMAAMTSVPADVMQTVLS